MVITVTLNAAVDKTYTVAGFLAEPGKHFTYRSSETKSVAGGKGINVARVLRELGRDVLATGFVGGFNGTMIRTCLDLECVPHDFQEVRGESRLCNTIVDPVRQATVDVNEHGPEVDRDDVESLLRRIESHLPSASHLIMSGSAPPGVPTDFYARAIGLAKAAGVVSVLDAGGSLLKMGVEALPEIVKPNASELSACVGRELKTEEDIITAARKLVDSGIRLVMVTMGESGAVAVDTSDAWTAVPPPIEFVSAVGSGDAFVAAMVDSLLSGCGVPDALRAGVAAGTTNATRFGAGFCTADEIRSLVGMVRVTKKW